MRQFEREVTGERIRDKIAASKKKGMFMGGAVSIGYEVKDRKLMINPREAEKVRLIYRRYLELGCVRLLHEELVHRNIRSKSDKAVLSRGALYSLLSIPIYIGQIRHKGVCSPGQHEAIIDPGIWEQVQQSLKGNSIKSSKAPRKTSPSLLVGKLFDESGGRLTPSHGIKNGVRYRYYISRTLMTGTKTQHQDEAGDCPRRKRSRWSFRPQKTCWVTGLRLQPLYMRLEFPHHMFLSRSRTLPE